MKRKDKHPFEKVDRRASEGEQEGQGWRQKQMETFKPEDYIKMDSELREMMGEPTKEGIATVQKILNRD